MPNRQQLATVWLPLLLTGVLSYSAIAAGGNLVGGSSSHQGVGGQSGPATSGAPASVIYTDGQPLKVVSSVAVWSSVAKALGQRLVSVSSLVSKPSQDPHSYVATARDQLAVNQANLTIENGNGYDTFFGTLTSAKPANQRDSKLVIGCHLVCAGATATAHANSNTLADNPHVWYSLTQVRVAAHRITKALAAQFPNNQQAQLQLATQATAFNSQLTSLQNLQTQVKTKVTGKRALLTESFAAYLLNDLGVQDLTPIGFRTAVENEQDASPAVMQQIQRQIAGRKIQVVITNQQTSGAQTNQIATWAAQAHIPVLKWSELLPAGNSYLTWMKTNLQQIRGALK